MPQSADHLAWIDLEMTGLDASRCHILEIGSLVTNPALEVVAEGPNLVIHLDEEQMATLSDWCREHLAALIERSRASTVSLEEAERKTLDFLSEYVPPRTSPLCGNSVHNDRAFLLARMPTLHDFLHYRNLDVSTVKELVKRWYPGKVHAPPKADSHRALVDIRESVLELRYYRRSFFVPVG